MSFWIAFSCGDGIFSNALYASSSEASFEDDMSCHIAPLWPVSTSAAIDREIAYLT